MSDEMTFGPLRITFDSRVLRPRPWTTAQSEWGAAVATDLPDGPVLELCAGAGHIGLLSVLDSQRPLVCVDANPAACDFARANAHAAGMAERVDVRHARFEEALAPDETFPLILADPPWVPAAETDRFPEDPLSAIDGGDDGLDVARACLRVIDDHLAPSGSAILQLGTVEQVTSLCTEDALGVRLAVAEVRQHERGVLVRIDRVGTSPDPAGRHLRQV